VYYSRIVLDSSKRLDAARALYLKARFCRYPNTTTITELMLLWKEDY
jgi:hypothetical protein